MGSGRAACFFKEQLAVDIFDENALAVNDRRTFPVFLAAFVFEFFDDPGKSVPERFLQLAFVRRAQRSQSHSSFLRFDENRF